MSTYAIGDIQGCCKHLKQLLKSIHFNENKDKLWVAGDLVARGKYSLETLRFIYNLNSQVVLGNHDINLLAIVAKKRKLRANDNLEALLNASDCQKLINWLRRRPLLHYDKKFNLMMVHAGLPPQWDLKSAKKYAHEVEQVLAGKHYISYLAHVFGDKPDIWSENLKSWDRLRFITSCFTRIRYCDTNGRLLMEDKLAPNINKTNKNLHAWFRHPKRASKNVGIIFGHWASLGHHTEKNIYALDSGCVWGGELTALRLEDKKVFQIKC
jgi:bis(5'-nucleosyl)-tetraphosphatase (symmetrical)